MVTTNMMITHTAQRLQMKSPGPAVCIFFAVLHNFQSMGSMPLSFSQAFVLEKCLQPKKPLSAEKGRGGPPSAPGALSHRPGFVFPAQFTMRHRKDSFMQRSFRMTAIGNLAQEKQSLVDETRHLVLKAAHPSPFSADKGFFGCKHFSKTKRLAEGQGHRAHRLEL